MRALVYTVYVLTSIAAANPKVDSVKLVMGQVAPSIQVEAWLKGDPISKFQSGKVYVLEFGFMACGPCRAAMPHLSELAEKYKEEVQVASIFVYENSRSSPGKAYVQKVKSFIEKQGDKIKYAVAVDTEQQAMAATWYELGAKSKMLGFPALFIIDRQGKIAWFGSMVLLDIMLEKVVHDDFEQASALALERNFDLAIRKVSEGSKKGDYSSAFEMYDSLIIQYPTFSVFPLQKFELLLKQDVQKAIVYGRQLLSNTFHDNEPALSKMVGIIISRFHIVEYSSNNDLYLLLLILADRALVLSPSPGAASSLHRLMVGACFFRGDYQNAIINLESAIDLYSRELPHNEEEAAKMMNTMQEQLKSYQQKLKEKG